MVYPERYRHCMLLFYSDMTTYNDIVSLFEGDEVRAAAFYRYEVEASTDNRVKAEWKLHLALVLEELTDLGVVQALRYDMV